MLKNEPTLAIWGVDTAENGPKENVWSNVVTFTIVSKGLYNVFTSYLEPRDAIHGERELTC